MLYVRTKTLMVICVIAIVSWLITADWAKAGLGCVALLMVIAYNVVANMIFGRRSSRRMPTGR